MRTESLERAAAVAVILAALAQPGCSGGGGGGDGGGGGGGGGGNAAAFNFNQANMMYAAGVGARAVDAFAAVSDLLDASFVALAQPGALVSGAPAPLLACAAGSASLAWTDVDRDGAWSSGDRASIALAGCRVHAGDAEALGGTVAVSFPSVTRGPPRTVTAAIVLDVTTSDGTPGTLRGEVAATATSPTGYDHAFVFQPSAASLLASTGATSFELACFDVRTDYHPDPASLRRVAILGSVRTLGAVMSFSPGAALRYGADDQPGGGELFLLSFMAQPSCPALGISDGVGGSDHSTLALRPGTAPGEMSVALYRDPGQLVTTTTCTWWTLLHPEPPATGIIHAMNAQQVASLAVTALALPRDVGALATDLVLGAYRGAPLGLCTSGGSYAVAPTPTLAVGETVTITFASCATSRLGAPATFDGSAAVTITGVAGAPSADVYTLATRIGPLDVTTVSDDGASHATGSLRFSRVAAGASVTERAEALPGAFLALEEEEDGDAVEHRFASFAVTAAAAADGGSTFASAGDAASVSSGSLPGRLAVDVTAPIRGIGQSPPDSGAMGITASDGTSLTFTVSTGGEVALGLDDDADGMVDATIPVRWTDLR